MANRSIAYLKKEFFGSALADASKALELDKNYIKGYYRRAAAQMALNKFKLAVKDLETVVKYRPNDRDAKNKFNECQKIVKRLAFERAIAVDEVKKSIADSIDIESIDINDDYDGPKLVDGRVTEEFMTQMIDCFKDGKKLHRKYAYKMILDVQTTVL